MTPEQQELYHLTNRVIELENVKPDEALADLKARFETKVKELAQLIVDTTYNLETKINRGVSLLNEAAGQDTKRIDDLEARLKKLEQSVKKQGPPDEKEKTVVIDKTPNWLRRWLK